MPRQPDQKTLDLSQRLKKTVGTEGWGDIKGHIEEEIDDARNELTEIMTKYPDRLTGKKAVSLGVGVRKLSGVLEWVDDNIRYGEANG